MQPLDSRATPQADAVRPAPAVGFLGGLRAAFVAHPRLWTWLVLSVGMVAILLWAARDTDLLPGQRLFLVAATVGLAALCTWIISWER